MCLEPTKEKHLLPLQSIRGPALKLGKEQRRCVKGQLCPSHTLPWLLKKSIVTLFIAHLLTFRFISMWPGQGANELDPWSLWRSCDRASPCRTTSLIATHYSDPPQGSPVPSVRTVPPDNMGHDLGGDDLGGSGTQVHPGRPLGGRKTHSQTGAALLGGAPRRPSSAQPPGGYLRQDVGYRACAQQGQSASMLLRFPWSGPKRKEAPSSLQGILLTETGGTSWSGNRARDYTSPVL